MFFLVAVKAKSDQARHSDDKNEQLQCECHARLPSTSMPAISNAVPRAINKNTIPQCGRDGSKSQYSEAKKLASEVIEDPKCGKNIKNVMQFFLIASLIMENNDASYLDDAFQSFMLWFNEMPSNTDHRWSFIATKNYVLSANNISNLNKRFILGMMRLLEVPKSSASIAEFKISVPDRFAKMISGN